MSDVLLILWIAFIGSDRIDLAGGHGPFILTPFLALTPLVMIAEAVRRRQMRHPIVLSRGAVAYAAAAAALLGIAVTSTFFSGEFVVSAPRCMLLVAQVVGTLAVAVLAADRDDIGRILARGALVSLPFFLVFDVMEALWWIGRAAEMIRLGPVSIRFDGLQNAGLIPRLAGTVGDGNRAGFVLLFYLVLIARGERVAWLRRVGLTLGFLLIAATISRSTTLAVVATGAVLVLERRRPPSMRVIAAAALVLAAACALVLVQPRLIDRVESLASSPLAQRLSTKEGSAQSHLALIGRGIDEATQSVPRALIGLGYGNSYLVLQDVFPGNRYGNFHSIYVTMFAECGAFALLLILMIMGTPLLVGGPWRALIAGCFAFNLFYQTTAEPTFWFVLAVSWLAMPLLPLSVSAARGTPRPQYHRS